LLIGYNRKQFLHLFWEGLLFVLSILSQMRVKVERLFFVRVKEMKNLYQNLTHLRVELQMDL
jgi:hypothetical protein